MSLGPLKERIEATVASLEVKLSNVESQEREFLDLQTALRENPKKLLVDDRVKVSLGEGWIVEYTVKDALGYAGRQLRRIGDEMDSVKKNLESARKAIADLEKLGDMEESKDETDDGYTEDGLPMMDIREELDEDGNVISSSIEPQKKDHELKDFAENHLSKIIQEREQELEKEKANSNSSDDGKKNINGKKVFGPPPPPPALEKDKESVEKKPQQDKPKSILKKPKPKVEEIGAETKRTLDRPPESLRNLKNDTRRQQIPENSSRITEIDDNESNEKPTESQSSKSVQQPAQDKRQLLHHHRSIDTEDLLQLELIANDITENEEDLDIDDMEFEEDEEDDDEEDEYGRSSVNYDYYSPEEIEKRTRAAEAAAEEARLSEKADSKQVRFSSEVEIKRFDKTKISNPESGLKESGVLSQSVEDQEVPKKKKKMSRFKAERLENKTGPSNVSVPDNFVPRTQETTRPVGEVMEREQPVQTQSERPVSDIIEKTDDSETGDDTLSLPASATGPVREILERQSVSAVVEKKPLPTGPVGDVLERSQPAEKDVKSIETQNGVSEASCPAVGEVVEKEPPQPTANESSQPLSRPQKTRNIFKKKPTNVLRKSKQAAKPAAPTPIPGMEAEKEIRPIQVSEDQQKSDTVDQISSSMNQGAFSKEIYDRAKQHFQDAILTEEEFIQVHDDGEGNEEEGDDNEAREVKDHRADYKSRPVLSTEIAENASTSPMIAPKMLLNELSDDDDEDATVNMSELRNEYHRLRNRLIQKSGGFKLTPQEQEEEPVGEDGNPIKMSRFKAARLSNRNL